MSRGNESDLSGEVTEVPEPKKPDEKEFDIPPQQEIDIENIESNEYEKRLDAYQRVLQGFRNGYLTDAQDDALRKYVVQELPAIFKESVVEGIRKQLDEPVTECKKNLDEIKEMKDGIERTMQVKFDQLFAQYDEQLKSVMAQKLKQFDSDILTKEKGLKERNFLEHSDEKSKRDSIASKNAEWSLFYHLYLLMVNARQRGMNQEQLRKELCKPIAIIDNVLRNYHGYQLKLSRKRAIFQIFYEIVTDKNPDNASKYKNKLINMLTPRDDQFPSQLILHHIQQPHFINNIIGTLKVTQITLTPQQAIKFEKIRADYQENLTNKGEGPTFHLGWLVDKDTDVFIVIALIQAVLGVSRINEEKWYDPEKKILYASPLNPYVLCI